MVNGQRRTVSDPGKEKLVTWFVVVWLDDMGFGSFSYVSICKPISDLMATFINDLCGFRCDLL